ncbi:MAG TPA: ankyrin repeat domain-containing protein [Mycobacteriales bacterium]|nr:ankyrin repeat domain-containing protein [Mycobacteriales bacterium]
MSPDGQDPAVPTLPHGDPLAGELVATIHRGDLEALRALLDANPDLARVRMIGRHGPAGGWRSPLHVTADWPGYFPEAPAAVQILVAAGGDPNVDTGGDRPETPLHWAASSDDREVALALIDAGADLERPGGSIGSPLDNAIGYGCWHVARLLVERGAAVNVPWHAAALGDLDRLGELLEHKPDEYEISKAFWHACSGAQRRAAELLLAHGADLNWVPDYAEGTPLDSASGTGTRRENVIRWLRDLGARSSHTP